MNKIIRNIIISFVIVLVVSVSGVLTFQYIKKCELSKRYFQMALITLPEEKANTGSWSNVYVTKEVQIADNVTYNGSLCVYLYWTEKSNTVDPHTKEVIWNSSDHYSGYIQKQSNDFFDWFISVTTISDNISVDSNGVVLQNNNIPEESATIHYVYYTKNKEHAFDNIGDITRNRKVYDEYVQELDRHDEYIKIDSFSETDRNHLYGRISEMTENIKKANYPKGE